MAGGAGLAGARARRADLVALPRLQAHGERACAAIRSGAPVPTEPAEARPAAEAVGSWPDDPSIGARCLGRSLVLWFLLRRRGIDAELVIGADMPRGGELPAHAWVEVAGEPVNDAPDVRERFGSFDLQLPRLAETGRQ